MHRAKPSVRVSLYVRHMIAGALLQTSLHVSSTVQVGVITQTRLAGWSTICRLGQHDLRDSRPQASKQQQWAERR